jgi:hypothetical protein
MLTQLDSFARAYIACALWSSTDDKGNPLDDTYSAEDLAPETLEKMLADCERFQAEQKSVVESALGADFELRYDHISSRLTWTMAAHDFWLTRNGHGCGFFDGDWPEPQAGQLTLASKAFGEFNLYIGDDGKIYS